MKKLLHLFSFFSLLVTALVAASSCGAVRHSCPSSQLDSTRVEVRTEVKTVHDTAFVELPVIVERIQTMDTTSTLENRFARSEATVSGGILHHSLETKPAKLPAEVVHLIIFKDSLVYRDRVVTQTIEVPSKLTKWQQVRQTLGSIFLILIVMAILYLFLHFSNLLNLKRL